MIHGQSLYLSMTEIFQEAIGMTERKIKRAIYEPNNSDLNLRKKIYELDINYASNIIVYF